MKQIYNGGHGGSSGTGGSTYRGEGRGQSAGFGNGHEGNGHGRGFAQGGGNTLAGTGASGSFVEGVEILSAAEEFIRLFGATA